MIANRNLGRVRMPLRMLLTMSDEAADLIFRGFVVIDATRSWNDDTVEYVARHPDFRVVGKGELLPEYQAIVGAGCGMPTWKEVKR